ncbi:phytoene desaturase [Vulcanimicrobium alpinum]|uniref:Phytoene desaturase n=1 Tax=Vulcanimicrobium alpinum TaxID=3016050 RepID=A0AAN1XZ29_UNVUL|nr:FAD-dependent oxidoreductase [Vulcanimicrobium alpinum]BDE07356.1 phytoene desaturase [Vulcanimicrobium alpinum]
MVDTLIVGGGPAGLAAAQFLADAGRTATVLEKRPILGGKLSSWRDRDGDILETGLHAFFGGYASLHALLKEVGIAHHVLWQPHALTWAMPPHFSPRWNGKPVYEEFRFVDAPSPLNGIGAVLNAKYVFNNWEKVLFAKGTLPVLLRDHEYAEKQDDITYAEWHRRRGMSEHMLQTFFAPMALALNFTPVERISAEAMLRVMAYFASERNASRAGFLDGPPGPRFVEPLAAHVRKRGVQIESTAAVAELLFSGDRCIGAKTRDGRTFEAGSVILATPVHDAKKILPAEMLRDPSIHGIAKLESSPIINAHLWFDRPVSPFTNLMFSPGTVLSVHADLGQASPGYEWEGRSFIEACVAPADELITLDDETVVARIMEDLGKLYPLATREHLVKAKLVRVPKSVYRASPGAERLRPGARTPVRNLFLAGCYVNTRFPASIEGAVRSARGAVDALLAEQRARA